jgi:hypothetical protein
MEELKEELDKFDIVSRFTSFTNHWDRVSFPISLSIHVDSNFSTSQMWMSSLSETVWTMKRF